MPYRSQTTLELTTASSDTSSYLQWRCACRLTTSTLASILFNQDLWRFYYGNELLARNTTGKLSALSGAHHQHTRVPYTSLPYISWADYHLFQQHFFSSPSEVHSAQVTRPLTTTYALTNELLARNNTSNLGTPSGPLHQHTRVSNDSHASFSRLAQDSHLTFYIKPSRSFTSSYE